MIYMYAFWGATALISLFSIIITILERMKKSKNLQEYEFYYCVGRYEYVVATKTCKEPTRTKVWAALASLPGTKTGVTGYGYRITKN